MVHDARHIAETGRACGGEALLSGDGLIRAVVPLNDERLEHAVPLDRIDQHRKRIRRRIAHIDRMDRDVLNRHRRPRAIELLDVVRVGSHAERGRQPLAERMARIGWSLSLGVGSQGGGRT